MSRLLGNAKGFQRNLAQVGTVRIVSLGISTVFTVLTSRLVISHEGPAGYGFVTLVAGLSALLPFTDLGIGAPLTNAAAVRDTDPAGLRATLVGALRVLSVVALVLIAVDALFLVTHTWSTILGVEPGHGLEPNVAAASVVGLFAVTVPLGVGQRLLIGSGHNARTIVISAVSSPLTFLCVLALITLRAPTWLVPTAWTASTVVVTFAMTTVAFRMLRIDVRELLGMVLARSRHPGAPLKAQAVPMFVIAMALPLALQTDRIVLSHRSTLDQVAVYSLVALLYAPFWAVISSMGMSLWPWFAGMRARGARSTTVLLKAVGLFSAMGAVGLVVMVLIGPIILPIASKDIVASPVGVILASGTVLLVQAAHTPSGMFLTDASGLRFQAVAVVAMVVVNFSLSWTLAAPLGAAGPLMATAISVAVCQLVPTFLKALSRSGGQVHASVT